MIRYALKCGDGHGFESWFGSAEAFDKLTRAGQVSCPACGSVSIEKALMAPGVAASLPAKSDASPLAALKSHVERTADYVGKNFAARARAMHDGAEPHRPIYGEAALPDVRALVRDGIPVAPLPFVPKSKVN